VVALCFSDHGGSRRVGSLATTFTLSILSAARVSGKPR
jgi:hypothetical protein